MDEIMLLSLWDETCLRTFSLRADSQSILRLRMPGTTAHDAVASVEASEGGLLVRTIGEHRFAVPGTDGALEGPIVVDCSSATMLGIEPGKGKRPLALFIRPAKKGMYDNVALAFRNDTAFEVGRDARCALCYGSAYVSGGHARVSFACGGFAVQDLGSGNGTFVNGRRVASLQKRDLVAGDIVQILDLVFVVGNGYLLANRPVELSVVAGRDIATVSLDALPNTRGMASGTGAPLEFYPAPWLRESLRTESLSVEAPPDAEQDEERSLLMRVGPSMCMGLSSAWLGARGLAGILRGDALPDSLANVVMALAMLCAMVVWPVISSLHDRKSTRDKELLRQERYVAYLDDVEDRLYRLAGEQSRLLKDRYSSVSDLLLRARERSPLLMSHASKGKDFLVLRVGTGDRDLCATVEWPKWTLGVDADPLWARVQSLHDRCPSLRDIPLVLDLGSCGVVGVLGEHAYVWEFLRGLIVQVCALYSYEEVRVCLVCHEEERVEWEPFAYVGHAYDDFGEDRLVALSSRGMERIDKAVENSGKEGGVRYVIVCTDPGLLRTSRTASYAGAEDSFVSVVYAGESLYDLPRESERIVELGIASAPAGERVSRMYDRSDVAGTMIRFSPDIMVSTEQAWRFVREMGRVRLGKVIGRGQAPQVVGFLDLFKAGSTRHLDVVGRWSASNPAVTLGTPIGILDGGGLACIDLHERSDGPHALVAGTTGSGKSELLITLVLSLSVSYPPDEVAFMLIDYKGGGLVDAFLSGRRRLPHLAGTVTNLDGRAIRRALASLGGELRRRQRVLRAARDLVGEATMDIHRYLSLYREGTVLEPLPHLFIIADEFAELRQQEPEFMDELMSAARIGRSLGVHLVLATQKPTGVVNDQIWSNARLKISLKVSDVSDSREILRRDDAARISRPGFFYSLVGYDESYSGGQAAYAGLPYCPASIYSARQDESVDLLDAEGQVVASVGPFPEALSSGVSELDAVVECVMAAAEMRDLAALPLWLEPLPACIPLDELLLAYPEQGTQEGVALLGEADDPDRQARLPLSVDLSTTANVLLYGTQGSDVEGLLRVLVVSLVRAASPRSMWVYALDMGEGMFSSLGSLPHVGGVVGLGDDEGVVQLFRLLGEELDRRRGQTVPKGSATVVLAIANLSLLFEAYPASEESLAALVRDAPRFGIHVLATADGVSSVHGRLRSAFDLVLPTTLVDDADYTYLLGSSTTPAPPKQWRRGLARMGEEVLEFQGATLGASRDAEAAYIEGLVRANEWASLDGAPAIPRLPVVVTCRDMHLATKDACLPVGYAVQDVRPVTLTANQSVATLVVGGSRDALLSYVFGAVDAYDDGGGETYAVVDLTGWCAQRPMERVVTTPEAANALVEDLGSRHGVRLLVVLGMAQTFGLLSARAKEMLVRVAEGDALDGKTMVAFVCESWRLAGLYDEWYQALMVRGNGLWVGGGFVEQTVLRVSHMGFSYSHHKPSAHDGYLVQEGDVTHVRLVREESEAI